MVVGEGGGLGKADELTSRANITTGRLPSKAEVLWGLRNFPNRDKLEHDSADRSKGKGAKKEAAYICLTELGNDLSLARPTVLPFGEKCPIKLLVTGKIIR